MAWNPPALFVPGPLAAAQLNQIRESLLALYGVTSDGTFQSFVPTWSNVTLGSGATNTGKFIQIGKWTEVQFTLILGAGGALTGTATLALPVTAAAADVTDIGRARLSHGGSRSHADVVKTSSTTAIFDYLNVASLGPALGATVNAAGPWSWATPDSISGTFAYESV